MVYHGKSKLFGRLYLQLLYLRVLELGYLRALDADDVVVVAVFREVLVPGLAVPELPRYRKAALAEELVEAYVGVGLEEGLGDEIPLRCRLETFGVDKGFQDGHLVRWLHSRNLP